MPFHLPEPWRVKVVEPIRLPTPETREQSLAAAGVRAELDDRNEKLGYRIREAQLAKVPCMLVVGAKEQEAGTVAVRVRTGEDRGPRPTGEVAARIAELTGSRSLEL